LLLPVKTGIFLAIRVVGSPDHHNPLPSFEALRLMNHKSLTSLLTRFQRGSLSLERVVERIAGAAGESLGFATVDHHRELRLGFPEVILAEGKTPAQVAGIAGSIVKHGSVLLATRATKAHYNAVRRVVRKSRYNPVARTIVGNEHLVKKQGKGSICIVTAGTSDLPTAEEAMETAKAMGNDVTLVADVGVAGIHRLLSRAEQIRKAAVIIVVAGMEGALPSVVGGLVSAPVIAVPTSTGYGVSLSGVAALLGMLNSCASGITVVNIDNGFGAAFAATRINRLKDNRNP
jgi:NCAIR mutase (PurE)-related protein